MSLENLGNIGELISAIAVVVSLVYLAIQIRQNTDQIRESSALSRVSIQENFVSGQQAFFHNLLSSEDVYRVWRLGWTATEELPEEDRERFGLLLYSQMYRYHVMFQARSLEPLEHQRSLIQIDRLASLPAFRSWWSRQREAFGFDAEFADMVEARIVQVESGPADGDSVAVGSSGSANL